MNTSSSEVVEFLSRKKDFTNEIKKKALIHIIDGFAVMLAGSRTDCAKKLMKFSQNQSKETSSSIIGSNKRTSSLFAALVNGTSGHADDYDDTQLASSPDRTYGLLTHPTVPVLASALAVGEFVSCTGTEFLESFISGFEIECKIAEAINPLHYRKGFHTTGTIGAFGSFGASSVLLKLNEESLRYGLSVTASLSSGLRVNFGTMTKPLHAGRAAANGLMASMLGHSGFTADKNGLDGRWGFFNVMGDGYDEEKIQGKLGNPYSIIDPGATLKMYPCGSLGQPSMDTLLEIVNEFNITPDMVKEINLRAGPNILEPLRYKKPVNELQAKFSLQFGLASILLKRKAGLREYADDFVTSTPVRELMSKVKTIHDPEIANLGTEKMRSVVEIKLLDGRNIERVADTARGTKEKPLSENDIYDKFVECSSFVLNMKDIDNIFEAIRNIEKFSDINDLTKIFYYK
jgi:2-methylcitrate dehydratase PrpD